MNLSQWNLPSAVVENYNAHGLKKMFSWQAECLRLPGVLDGKNLVYSAPTGAGKSLVAEILLLKRFLKTGKKAIYILPFISLAREKMFSMRAVFEVIGLRIDGYMGGLSPAGGFASVDVAVCTIEKANALINKLIDDKQIEKLGMVIVDEIHMVGDANRGYLIELLLTKLKYMNEMKHLSDCGENFNVSVIGMSATVPNLQLLALWLNAEFYQTEFRPVSLLNYLKIGNDFFDSALKKIKTNSSDYDLKGDEDGIAGLCLETLEANHSTLIFCPTKNWCENLAQSISQQFTKLLSDASHRFTPDKKSINDILEQLRRSPAGLDDVLMRTIPRAVAYHHAGLTTEERDIVENGFRNNVIRVLIATSTLSSGVNLPARRVIIRTPSFNRGLLDVRSYHQMAGRAGRKGIDDVGESILICKPHERIKGKKLMSSSLPPVRSCLVNTESRDEVTSAVRRAILEVIVNGIATTCDQVQTYINCTLFSAQIAWDDHNNRNRMRSGSSGKRNNNVELISNCIEWLKEQEFVHVQSCDDVGGASSTITPTKLGKAALMSSLPTAEALRVLADLQSASKSFALDSELHLVYQITPIYTLSSNINWFNFLNLYESLPPAHRRVADLVGVEEAFITRLAASGGWKASHRMSEARERQVNIHTRFYASLILHDLVQELPLRDVCSKYVENRGMIQSLQQSAATFAGMVTAFCQQLGWWSLELLLREFQSRLVFGVQRELLDLMEISLLNSERARALYTAGLTTCDAVACSSPIDVELILRNANRFKSKRDSDSTSTLRGIRVPGTSRSLNEKEAAAWIVNQAKSIRGQSNQSDFNVEASEDKFDSGTPTHVHESKLLRDERIHPSNSELSVMKDSIVRNDTGNPDAVDRVTLTGSKDEFDAMKSQPINDRLDTALKAEILEHSKDLGDIVEEKPNAHSSITESQMAAMLEEDFFVSTQPSSCEPTSSTPIAQHDHQRSPFTTPHPRDQVETTSSPGDRKLNGVNDGSLDNLFSSVHDFSAAMYEASSSGCKKNVSQPLGSAASSVDWSTESVFQCQASLKIADHRETNDATINSSTGSVPFSNYVRSNHDDDRSIESVQDELSRLSVSNSRMFDESRHSDVSPHLSTSTNGKLREKEKIFFQKSFKIVEVTKDSFEKFFKMWKKRSKFSLVIKIPDEKIDNLSAQTFIMAIYWDRHCVYFIDFQISPSDEKQDDDVAVRLRHTLNSFPQTTIINSFNSKRTAKLLLRHFQFDVHRTNWRDPRIALWLLDPEDEEDSDALGLFEKHAPENFRLFKEFLRTDSIARKLRRDHLKACVEVVASHLILDEVEEKLRDESLWKPFVDVEMPHDLSMALLESNGIAIDTFKLNELMSELYERRRALQERAWRAAGRQFSLASVAEIRKIFLELGIVDKSFGKYWSTSKDVLNRLAMESNPHPLISIVVDWRSINYAFTCVQQVNRFLQSSSSQSGAVVRRYHPSTQLTSVGKINMKMQFIPKTKQLNNQDSDSIEDYSFSLREFFVASEDFVLLAADYSQLELRVMAHFSADDSLLKAFRNGTDLFRELAAEFYSKQHRVDEVTEDERRMAKEVVYAVNYGVGSKSLSTKINLSEQEMDSFRRKFTETYPRLHLYFNHIIESCRKQGYVTTLRGRRRYLPNIRHRNPELRSKAERQARNSTIAGSAADIVKIATVKINAEMQRRGWNVARRRSNCCATNSNCCFLIHQLHDELIYEVRSHLVSEAAVIVRDGMSEGVKLQVPLVVKIKTGPTWKDLEPYPGA